MRPKPCVNFLEDDFSCVLLLRAARLLCEEHILRRCVLNSWKICQIDKNGSSGIVLLLLKDFLNTKVRTTTVDLFFANSLNGLCVGGKMMSFTIDGVFDF